MRTAALIFLALAVATPPQSAAWRGKPSRSEVRRRAAACEMKMNAPLDPSQPTPLLDPVSSVEADAKVVRPKLIHKVDPVIPPLLSSDQRGTVIMKAYIDEDGCVRDPKVLNGINDLMDRSALEAFRQFVFLPATLDGKPVRVQYVFTINFHTVLPKPPSSPNL